MKFIERIKNLLCKIGLHQNKEVSKEYTYYHHIITKTVCRRCGKTSVDDDYIILADM